MTSHPQHDTSGISRIVESGIERRLAGLSKSRVVVVDGMAAAEEPGRHMRRVSGAWEGDPYGPRRPGGVEMSG